MDSKNDEQTELLRAIWQQLVTVDKTLNTKIDQLDERLSARIDAQSTRIDSQSELLRGIWQQLVTVDKTLNTKIDKLDTTLNTKIDKLDERLSSRLDAFMQQTHENFARLNARIDSTNSTLDAFMQQTHENFGRVHRNFEKVNLRLEHIETGGSRVDDLDARLTRVETHVGLRED